MKKLLTGGLAALTLGGAVVAGAAPASAHGWGAGPAVAAGIAGLAVGAAIASGPHAYYAPPGYYYGPPPGYYVGPAYYTYWHGCRVHWRWDHHWGRYVRVRACY